MSFIDSQEDRAMRAAAARAEEDRHLRAVQHSRGKDINRIKFHKSRGMSRKRLIDIYGRDAVDLALANI